jgi:hypothetical protein
MTTGPTLTFSCDLDERAEWEIEQKGWFEQAFVHLSGRQTRATAFLGL